jgi:imidazolonepropionase-like amidohydrolase
MWPGRFGRGNLMILTISNGTVLDVEDGRLVGERTVVVEDGEIVDVVDGVGVVSADRDIDARGRFVVPGFIDAHVHMGIPTMDLSRIGSMSDVERSLAMAATAAATVERGFTTVRDTGGHVQGLIAAIARGMCRGPRIVSAGRVLSQTGGHGDFRRSRVDPPGCGCEIWSDHMSHVADGADAVRKAARHELREGSAFLKIMSSGGVASPSDPLDSIQYTAAEIDAVAVEAAHRNTYVTSHAYQPDAIRLAIDNGVSCIEHGNMIDVATAEHMADLGVTMVPTLVTYEAMDEVGEKFGLPATSREKNAGVFEEGLRSIELARAARVELGLGTDLLGETQDRQNRELAIRAEVEPAIDVLRSMYLTNARLCHLEGRIGVVAPGAIADLLVVDVDPIERITALAEPGSHLRAIVQAGRVLRDDGVVDLS